jgi:hypothetical protein
MGVARRYFFAKAPRSRKGFHYFLWYLGLWRGAPARGNQLIQPRKFGIAVNAAPTTWSPIRFVFAARAEIPTMSEASSEGVIHNCYLTQWWGMREEGSQEKGRCLESLTVERPLFEGAREKRQIQPTPRIAIEYVPSNTVFSDIEN